MNSDLIINYISLFNSTVITTHNILKFIINYGIQYNNYSNSKFTEFNQMQKFLKNNCLMFKLNFITMLIKHILTNVPTENIPNLLTDNDYEIINCKNVLLELPENNI